MSHAKAGLRGVKSYIRLPIYDGNKPNMVLNEIIIGVGQNIILSRFIWPLPSEDKIKLSKFNSDFQIKFLFLVLSFQKRIALVYFFKTD